MKCSPLWQSWKVNCACVTLRLSIFSLILMLKPDSRSRELWGETEAEESLSADSPGRILESIACFSTWCRFIVFHAETFLWIAVGTIIITYPAIYNLNISKRIFGNVVFVFVSYRPVQNIENSNKQVRCVCQPAFFPCNRLTGSWTVPGGQGCFSAEERAESKDFGQERHQLADSIAVGCVFMCVLPSANWLLIRYQSGRNYYIQMCHIWARCMVNYCECELWISHLAMAVRPFLGVNQHGQVAVPAPGSAWKPTFGAFEKAVPQNGSVSSFVIGYFKPIVTEWNQLLNVVSSLDSEWPVLRKPLMWLFFSFGSFRGSDTKLSARARAKDSEALLCVEARF